VWPQEKVWPLHLLVWHQRICSYNTNRGGCLLCLELCTYSANSSTSIHQLKCQQLKGQRSRIFLTFGHCIYVMVISHLKSIRYTPRQWKSEMEVTFLWQGNAAFSKYQSYQSSVY
jgi:aromatic ring-opening dioxygenase LigB subunit